MYGFEVILIVFFMYPDHIGRYAHQVGTFETMEECGYFRADYLPRKDVVNAWCLPLKGG